MLQTCFGSFVFSGIFSDLLEISARNCNLNLVLKNQILSIFEAKNMKLEQLHGFNIVGPVIACINAFPCAMNWPWSMLEFIWWNSKKNFFEKKFFLTLLGQKSHMAEKVGQLQKISEIGKFILKLLQKRKNNVFHRFFRKMRIFHKKYGQKSLKTRLCFFTTSAASACTSACTSKFLYFLRVLYMPYIHHKYWSNRINSKKVMPMGGFVTFFSTTSVWSFHAC